MLIDWTKHLSTDKEKEEFEKTVYGAKRVLDRLKALIEERELAMDLHERSLKQFEVPNWDYKQAYTLGYRAASETYKKIVDLDKQIQKETKPNE